MIFHQVQLMVCSMLAQRYKKAGEKLATGEKATTSSKAVVESQK